MPFDDLPAQPPVNIRADAYAETALRLSRLAAMTVRTVLDVAYGPDKKQTLDIYLPPEGTPGPWPVFLNIHGGAWTHGYKEWMGLNAPAIVAFPAIYISLSYRLAPDHKYPACSTIASLPWPGPTLMSRSMAGSPIACSSAAILQVASLLPSSRCGGIFWQGTGCPTMSSRRAFRIAASST